MADTNTKKSWWINFISTILILGAFLIAALVLANVGIRVYQNVVLANDNNFELRTSLNYVATKVRQKDTVDSVRIEKKDGVDVLILGYEYEGSINETIIYFYNGYLREHIRTGDSDYSLDFGIEIMEIADFKMELINDNFLKLIATNSAGEQDELILYLRAGR